jgi:hypothetical protein
MLTLVKPYGKITWLCAACHIDTTLELFREQLVSCHTFNLGQKWFRIKVGIEIIFWQPMAWASMHSSFILFWGGRWIFLIFFLVPFVFSSNSQRVPKVPKMLPNTFPITPHLSCILCPKFYLVTYNFPQKNYWQLDQFLCPSQKDYLFIYYLFIQVTTSTLSL